MIHEGTIIKIKKYKTNNKTNIFYDLETEKNHNFFANDILVHNSGTAFRDDKRDMDITAVTGYKCFDLPAKTLIDNGWLMAPKITFLKLNISSEEIKDMERKSELGLINETKNYALYYNVFISENQKRNDKIKDIVLQNKGKKILVLTKLIEHGRLLSEMTGGIHLYGSTDKEERKQMLQDFKDGKNNVLVSTLSIFSEGVDICSLNLVCNASANKGDVKTIQVLGRVLRKNEGKEMAEYYDFIDESKFFKSASRSRIKAFQKEGHEVEING